MTNLADVGEFGLIERIRRIVEPSNASSRVGPRLEISIGDDAAAWRVLDGSRQVITTDALVEGVHFDLLTTSWQDLGWKSLAVNLSDVAAMGVEPDLAVITLGLPRQTEVEDVERFYEGLTECARRWGVAIVGGDIVASPILTVNVSALGASTAPLLRRSAGQPGDLLAVTGWLGLSGGGLQLLDRGLVSAPDGDAAVLLSAHRRPIPRVAEAQCLVRAGVRCAMDVSDGLRGDAAHICEQSDLSASIEIDRVPLHSALVAALGRDQALGLALDGGEDYELLCAGPAEIVAAAARLMERETGTALHVIGELRTSEREGRLVSLIDASGEEVELAPGSWDHFRA